MVREELQQRIRTVFTDQAPQPKGHYSQAVVYDNLVYVAGQLGIDPLTGESRLRSIKEETEQVLSNIAAILRAAGSDLGCIVKTTVFVDDIRHWNQINAVYESFMGDHRPARSVVPTGPLHLGYHVEIEVIAACGVAGAGETSLLSGCGKHFA